MTFLAIDVGNTRLKWAMYEQAHANARQLSHGAVFLENIDKLAEGEWAALPAPERMLGCLVAAEAVGRAFATTIRREGGTRVALGRDVRPSSVRMMPSFFALYGG